MLLEGASYGYAMAQGIAERSEGAYVIKETTLYAAIRRLEKRGDVEAFPGAETTGRPRTYYRITESGVEIECNPSKSARSPLPHLLY